MVDKDLLRSKMLEFRDRQEELAAAIPLSYANLSLKINGVNEFKRSEIEKIALRYKLTAKDIQRIFFANTVAQNETKKEKKATKGD